MYFTFSSTDLFLLTCMASSPVVTSAAIYFTLSKNIRPNWILTNPDFIWSQNQICRNHLDWKWDSDRMIGTRFLDNAHSTTKLNNVSGPIGQTYLLVQGVDNDFHNQFDSIRFWFLSILSIHSIQLNFESRNWTCDLPIRDQESSVCSTFCTLGFILKLELHFLSSYQAFF